MREIGKISVAIIGGGLGGTALMNSLMKFEHIDANIYEAKDTFKERGASVGLSGNAQRALRLMGLGNIMDNTGAVPVNGARCIIGQGPDQGKRVLDKMGDLSTVHRAALLRELVGPIPENRMHVNKKLTNIDGRIITFADGTTVTADVIIGADGIHSSVRKFVLGEGHPALDPVNSGTYDFRTVVPFETALAKIGAEHLRPEHPTQTIYTGDGAIVFFDYIEEGQMICLVGAGFSPDDWDKKQWRQSVPREWLLKKYQDWPGFAKEMVQLLCAEEEVPLFITWESGDTPTLFNGNICIMGDAAHATTPWQGAGLGLAIEDALILQTVLGECKSMGDVAAGLAVYDELMRPRGRQVVVSSREMGQLLLGTRGLLAEPMKQTMTPMWEFIDNWKTAEVIAQVAEKVRASSNKMTA